MISRLSALDFMRTAASAAQHFGFEPVERVRQREECKACAKKIPHKTTATERRSDALHGMLANGTCMYFDNNLQAIDGPVLFYSLDQVPRSLEPAITLQVFGVKKSIAEAILIQTIRSLLIELGFTSHSVRVNSIGDQDSVTRYIRELTNYMRKRLDDMPAPSRELMKEHVFSALAHLIEREHELAYRCPSPLEYLTDQSRKHFREIVEYLDMSSIPYEIDPRLIGSQDCYSEALFSFDIFDTEGTPYETSPLFIRGGRYNNFVKRMSKMDVDAVGAVVVLRNKKVPPHISVPRANQISPVFVVQLGFGPKIKSLLLIDELRHAGIPVRQDITSDSLSAQLRKAEAEKAQFAVIMGQKEYVDGNVILRDLHARNQENVPITALPGHLKRLMRA